MNRATAFFLLLLRLAIGWHLLFAGLEKFDPEYGGSEGYLRQATGPAAPLYEKILGEPLLERYDVVVAADGADPAQDKAHERTPLGLNRQWDAYFEAFVDFYDLEGAQLDEAKGKLKQEKAALVNWIETGRKVVVLQSPSGTDAKVPGTVRERIEKYKKELRRVRNLVREKEKVDLAVLTGSPPPENRDLAIARAEVASLRRELQGDLDARTEQMKESLRSVLTDEQRAEGGPRGPYHPSWSEMSRLDWADFAVRWGLVLVGACLMLGLFTRFSCVIGALMLLSFYLAVPPLPGLPAYVAAEGYPFINKNLVEMLALLALATTSSGCWFGLDGVFHVWWRGKRPTPQATETNPV